MLSSRFLAASFLYIFYATGLVAADPHWGVNQGNQGCQNVPPVTITRTVALGQPSPNKGLTTTPLPAITSRPGNVNLNNGSSSSNVGKNTKNVNTNTKDVKTNTKNVNTNTKNVNTNTKNVNTKTVNTNTKTVNTNTKTVNTNTKTVNTNTKTVNTVKGTKTSSGVLSATPPPVKVASGGDPSTSLTLDPSVIQNINGSGQAAGEANSLVSPNNFIGFCVGKTITNGQQVQTGSCNPTPMGDIPAVGNMPSTKFNLPKNFDTIAANTPFTISLQVLNLVTGTFTNAANTYYAAPQQLVKGVIQGHSHVTVQLMTSLDSPTPLDPKVFAFFKGLNAASPDGVLTADVTKGLPAGVYRISSINSAGNHQEALGPVAQRGSFNDVIYITVSDNGNSTDVVPPASSGTKSTPIVKPTATPPSKSTGKGGKNTSSATLPVSTNKGGKNGGSGGDVLKTTTPVAPPKATNPPAGNGKVNVKDTAVSSSTVPPKSTATKGVTSKGGKGFGVDNGQYWKRIQKRSRRA